MSCKTSPDIVSVPDCEYQGVCAEASSFLATPVSKTHDFAAKHSCVRHLGKIIKYEDDDLIDFWYVEAL